MNVFNKKGYDVVIIGAGVSSLVCGCYLAKARLKVLIVEQHSIPGGYCTSFCRKGYEFDTAVHYIGGVRKGSLSKILKDFEADSLKFNQFDPTDKIIIPGSITYIRANPYATISEFKNSFPMESKNIDKFFKFIMEPNLVSIYRKAINFTFKEVLDNFFEDQKLKSTIGVLLLCNMDLPLSRISAFAAIIFFREFLLDPGYYPIGGMQQFSDFFASKFKQYGGDLILSRKVSKIIVRNKEAKGIVIDSKEKVVSKFVVSGVDATQTFKNLIDTESRESRIVSKLAFSNSIFALYLGLKSSSKNVIKDHCNIWFYTTNNIDKCYNSLNKNIINSDISGIMLTFPYAKDHSLQKAEHVTAQIFTMASYESKEFWDKNRNQLCKKMLSMAENIFPNMKEYIDLTVTATPFTFYRYTLNRNGAAFGWISTPEQMSTSLLPQRASIHNLFCVGHWTIMGTGQGGVSTVALSGKKAAEMILVRFKKK